MTPNYKNAAIKAMETYSKYGSDPLSILNQFPNVRVFPFSIDPSFDSCDAFTCVRESDDSFQYIIMYNNALPSYIIKRALARELGHIVLKHDGNSPENIWMEEANCFAYHYICPVTHFKKIKYRPRLANLSWEMKEVCVFDSIDNMKLYVVEEGNKFNRFIRSNKSNYQINDVELLEKAGFDNITGWKNCYDVVLDGRTVGYCGE